MLAKVELVIAPKEARLTLFKGEVVIEDEVWSFGRQIGRSEAAEFARAIFDDAYDAMNFMVHGDDDGC
jgi:hypothetical protein